MNVRRTTALRRHAIRLPTWLAALAAGVLLVGLAPVASMSAATQTLVPACDGVNVRTSASTRATIKVRLNRTATLTVSGSVGGASWSTTCPTRKSGSGWYRVTHVNGRSVPTLYGVTALYAATGVLTTPAVAPTPTSAAEPGASFPPDPTAQAMAPACNGVNIRTSASTRSSIKVRLGSAATLTVSGSVTGASWSTTCQTRKSGSGWYRVTEINGASVTALYGVAVLYAATGILTPAAVTPPSSPAPTVAPPIADATPAPNSATDPPPAPNDPAPTPESTAAPTPATTAAPTPAATAAPDPGIDLVPACDGVNIRTSASTSAPIKVRLGRNNTLTVTDTVAGAAWGTTCPTWKSGSGWYRVTHINGTSVSTLYGVAALYAATGILTSPVTASTTGVTGLGPMTTFYGRGYGHGVGLSQYGARGRALAGQSAADILAHYYANTTIGSMPSDTPIRVLVLDDFSPTATAPLAIYSRGGPSSVTAAGATVPTDGRLRLFAPATPGAGWRLVIDAAGGAVLYDAVAPTDFRIASATADSAIQVYSKPSVYDLYRGSLRVLATGSTVDVVNELPLESYLRGVVPAEMPSSWPLEARLAQTIAARSYAAYHVRPTAGTFDVYDDTRSQVYGGVKREQAAGDAAIASTTGQVLRSGGAVADTLFHSTAGGATENNENVFVSSTGAKVASPVSYLRGSSDRDPAGVPYDAAGPYATWQTKAYSLADLSAILAWDSRTNVGTLSGLDLRNRGVSGRLISVTLVGSSGTRVVSGDVFVAAFNAGRPPADPPLRSTLLDLAPIP